MDTKIIKKLDEIIQNMVTKNDLKQELAKYATKEDLKQELTRFATKGDLLAAKKELKDDITAAKKELKEYVGVGETAIIDSIEKHLVTKVNFLEERVEKVEHQLQQP